MKQGIKSEAYQTMRQSPWEIHQWQHMYQQVFVYTPTWLFKCVYPVLCQIWIVLRASYQSCEGHLHHVSSMAASQSDTWQLWPQVNATIVSYGCKSMCHLLVMSKYREYLPALDKASAGMVIYEPVASVLRVHSINLPSLPINVQPVNKYDPSQEYASTLLKRDQIISLPNYETKPLWNIPISAHVSNLICLYPKCLFKCVLC